MDEFLNKLMAAGRRYYVEYYSPWDQWLVVADDLVGQVAQLDWESAAQAEADRLNREAMRAVLEPLVGALQKIAGYDPVVTDMSREDCRWEAKDALATLTGETANG